MPASPGLLNQPLDISGDFFEPDNDCFIAQEIGEFDPDKGKGTLQWNFHRWVNELSFNQGGRRLKAFSDREIFWKDIPVNPLLPFQLSFINSRVFRLRLGSSAVEGEEASSLMLCGDPDSAGGWQVSESADRIDCKSEHGHLVLHKHRFCLELFDPEGKLLTRTLGSEILDAPHHKTLPLLFITRSSDYSRSMAASFSLFPDEKIYGCGESFTTLNKRGQKLVLFSTDTQSVETGAMYKPIPFFISSRGHGIFLHSSSPVTLDFGNHFDGSKLLFNGADTLDLFFFIGTPGEILSEYTALTGKSPLPPLWSFGLWMSRFSYRSEKEVIKTASRMREHRIPCDTIHIDAGWFAHGVNCDYEFAPDLFPDPVSMITHLKETGFRVSLWQLPYYSPGNPVFDEVVQKGLFIKDQKGGIPTGDVILDFSLPLARGWYAGKIRPLLEMGVSVIKADFGEAAPLNGNYASGRTGFYEHNLYPLRYARLLYQITGEVTGEPLIWARSAWAGSQRYPIHWGGDSEVSDNGMACTLRGGLSLGLSGFTFWSHDIGGFFSAPKEELFLRWAFFGLLSSHSRVHGFPPREPWEFSERFREVFRRIVELKYRLMPYVYTQAALASAHGWPLLKALFLNYPDDPTAWLIEDEYLFGDDMLVGPLLEENAKERSMYLPEGTWIDYQSGEILEGRQWQKIRALELPGIILVREGSLIPHISLAQSTAFMDWSTIQLVAFSQTEARGKFYPPRKQEMMDLRASNREGKWTLSGNPDIDGPSFQLIPFGEMNGFWNRI